MFALTRVALLIFAASATVTSAATPATRASVEARLRAYDLPPSEKDLQKLGRDVDLVLVEIAGNAKVEILIRVRAVSALANCGTVAARRFFDQTIDKYATSTVPADRLLLRKAAVGLGWMGGLTTPDRLGPLLENPDPDVRLDAAIGLGLTRLPGAAALLRKRLPVEPDARVRVHIGRQLATIDRALGATSPGPTPAPR